MKCVLIAAAALLLCAPSVRAQLPKITIPVPKVFTGDGKPADTSAKSAECPAFGRVKAQQRESVWCWAACAEMVYRYRGKKVTQQEVASKIHGQGQDGAAKVKAASVYEILIALAGAEGKTDRADRFMDRYNKEAAKGGKGVTIDVGTYINGWIEEESINTDDLIDEIKRRQPVVIGMAKDPRFEGGHAMVIYGVTYRLASKNMLERALSGEDGTKVSRAVGIRKYEIVSVKVMDPWAGEARELTGAEWLKDCDFMMSQRKAAAVLKKQDEAIKAR